MAMKEKRRKEEEKDRQKAEQLLMSHVASIKNGTSMVVGERVNGAAMLTPAGEVLMSSVVDDDIHINKTFIEVSGGEAVKLSLMSSRKSAAMINNETLAEGSLAALGDVSIMNSIESTRTAGSSSEVSTSAPVMRDESSANVLAPLDDSNNIAWANFGATPNFAESIYDVEQYKSSPVLSQFNVNVDEDLNEDIDDAKCTR